MRGAANFNDGAKMTVNVDLESTPAGLGSCVKNTGGTDTTPTSFTGETNNMNLNGNCAITANRRGFSVTFNQAVMPPMSALQPSIVSYILE